MKGKVKFFNKRKGWGFIAGEDEKDYFVHHTNINAPGFKVLEPDESVTFEVKVNEKGSYALNVTIDQ